MYYYDPVYFLFMIPSVIVMLIAKTMVNSRFRQYGKGTNSRSVTGRQAAEEVLRENGVTGVKIERVAGEFTDHFDPKTNTIRLSETVYDYPTISAVGVAAHEAGHAVQYAARYAPLTVRNAIIPVCNFGSSFGVFVIIAGYILQLFALVTLGIILFSLAVVFQLITLPVEFNASYRALKSIKTAGILTRDEAEGAKKVLTAAALTYVAALLSSVLTLMYYIFRANRNR